MLSLRFIPVLVVFSAIASSQSAGIALVASAQESPSKTAQAEESPLSVEYRRIAKATKRDSPEYREAIERALVKSHERGAADAFEQKIRHLLGLSYRKAKEYAKSTEILNANLGSDLDLRATDMLLVARNARDSKDLDGAIKLMEELAAQYPKTSAGQTATGELTRLTYQKRTLDTQANVESQGSRKGYLIGLNLLAIVVLMAIFVWRQMRKRARLAA